MRFETLTPIFGAFCALQSGTRPAKICHAFNGRGKLVRWPLRQASEFVHVVPATCGCIFHIVQLLVLDKVENPPLLISHPSNIASMHENSTEEHPQATSVSTGLPLCLA
jgi:hypothetical protein